MKVAPLSTQRPIKAVAATVERTIGLIALSPFVLQIKMNDASSVIVIVFSCHLKSACCR